MSCEDETRVDSTRSLYKRHRYPAEIIAHCVWLYYRFTLSLRDVAELMLARGIVVSYETIRTWCAKFGPEYTRGLRRRTPDPAINGFWMGCSSRSAESGSTCGGRAIRQGTSSFVLVQSRRNATAAKRFFGKLMRKQGRVPRVLVTDNLTSYVVAHRKLMPSVEHRRSKYLNYRAENSHQPTRQRERAMKFFRSPGAAQRFLAVFSAISPHFRPGRHKLTASDYPSEMTKRFATWSDATGVSAAA